MTTLQVLLSPRALGGHEKALFGWLADASRQAREPSSLVLRVALPGQRLLDAARDAGVPEDALVPLPEAVSPPDLLRLLGRWPRGMPLLLAPGVLHAQAWLLGAAITLGHRPWLYVPMTYTATFMGYRAAQVRDSLLKPLLRGAAGFVTIDDHQAGQLRSQWGITKPVHVLPNLARVDLLPQHTPPMPDPQGRLRVAYVGRFDTAMKGLDWLTAQLRSRPPALAHCRWRFQGEGSGAPLLHALAEDLGPERVSVQPFAPITSALSVSDVLLLASRYEGDPLVALEATALGWPVVATRTARLASLLPDASQYDFGDLNGLARALRALSTPEARARAVAHARSRLGARPGRGAYEGALRGLLHAWHLAPHEMRVRSVE